jgi:hypothetical protein
VCGVPGFGATIIPDFALLHPGYAGCIVSTALQNPPTPEPNQKYPVCGVPGFGATIIPDFALLHPGYAGYAGWRMDLIKNQKIQMCY